MKKIKKTFIYYCNKKELQHKSKQLPIMTTRFFPNFTEKVKVTIENYE
jgi:hypothetical protein